MANQHQYVKHSFPLKLELQVNVTHLSDFHHFTEERTAFILQDIEDEMREWLLRRLCKEFQMEEHITTACDFVSFEITSQEQQIEEGHICQYCGIKNSLINDHYNHIQFEHPGENLI